METALRIGTRGSPLALAQARMTAAAIAAAHPALRPCDLVPITTTGDRITDRPLADVGGKALWTKELDQALMGGTSDLSVHSMKDVESERPNAFALAAMLPRADVRDRLVGAESIDALPNGALVGTSSPRRAAQLLRLRSDLAIAPIRGNLATRLAKVERGEFDATLLAAAGLDRLGQGDVGAPIPVEVMLPAPGQAAVGIECRAGEAELRALLDAIDHAPTSAAVRAERAFARALGGSCHSPVAALARVRSGEIELRVEILSADGRERIAETARFPICDEDTPARLARALLADAPPSVRGLFGG